MQSCCKTCSACLLAFRQHGKVELKSQFKAQAIASEDFFGDNHTEADSSEEAVTFNAETCSSFFRETFEHHEVDFDDWVKSQSLDKTAASVEIGEAMSKPTAPCQSYLLSSEVGLVAMSNAQLLSAIDTAQETMKDFKSSIKNAAIFQNSTPCRPALRSKTRWTGKHGVSEEWAIIRDALVEASVGQEIQASALFHQTHCKASASKKVEVE